MAKKNKMQKNIIKRSPSSKGLKDKDIKPLRVKHSDEWEIEEYSDIKIYQPILIEGMPGIGNVGKVSMDILIEELNAELLMSFHSKNFPNSVFVGEDNLVDLPKIRLYFKRIKNQDYLLLTGDAQPVTEHASYAFSEVILKIFKEYSGKHIVTLGGIGLNTIPENPKVYITGNDKAFVNGMIKDFSKKKLLFESKIYGMVGPIIGISGLLLGIAKKRDVKAYCLLSETLGHPIYVGLKGSKAIIQILSRQYGFDIDFGRLDKEIKDMDSRLSGVNTDKESLQFGKHADVNYIG